MLNLNPELLDELLKDYQTPQDLMGEHGILKQLTKALVERCLNSEMTHHLQTEGEPPALASEADTSAPPPAASKTGKNRRNGYSSKTIKGEFGTLDIEVPRDRNGESEPQLIGKHQTRFTGFDEKIIVLYSRGLSTRDIESMNMTLRKVLRNHRTFPTDESAMKVVFLALQNVSQRWTMPIRDWKQALNRFAIEFEERMPH
jgi:putative transposase